MNAHAYSFLVTIAMFSVVSWLLGKHLRNRPLVSFVIGFILYPVVFGTIGDILPDGFTGFAICSGYLISLCTIVPIILRLKDKRPRCGQCATVLNPNAKICHACHTPIASNQSPNKGRPSNSRNTAKTIPCPECKKPIRENTIKVGINKCPYCLTEFECA